VSSVQKEIRTLSRFALGNETNVPLVCQLDAAGARVSAWIRCRSVHRDDIADATDTLYYDSHRENRQLLPATYHRPEVQWLDTDAILGFSDFL
jgi:hypothetical protein